MLQKWKTASLFKATSKKINYNRAMSIGIKTCENNFIFIIVLWSLKYDRDIKSNNQICFQL